MKSFCYLLFVSFLVTHFISCKSDKGTPQYGGFPADVGKIMVNKCAVSGCHNAQSSGACANLALDSWSDMFLGSSNGPVIIPYRTDFSPLLFFTNTFGDLDQGISIVPIMPYNAPPLSRAEMITLNNWITNGAPNNTGFVEFSNNPNRRKWYVTNQGCDVVCTFDEQAELTMRYINVGVTPAIEAPHQVKVSPDGQYWYVVFYAAGTVVQKFRTSDDSYVGDIYLGPALWSNLAISSDSKTGFVVNWNSPGSVFYLDLINLKILAEYQGANLFTYPHGTVINSATHTLYITAQYGNFIYKIDITNPLAPNIGQVSLNGQPPNPQHNSSSPDPHEIAFSPDSSRYYVTCQNTNDVKVFSASNDSMIADIATGYYPQEMSVSYLSSTPYIFVSCQEDTVSFPGKRGSVSVINYNNNTLACKNIFTGWQPHGIAVDDYTGQVLVANRNVNPTGPAPHHQNSCGGRNGYVTFINVSNLSCNYNHQVEVSADPYSVAFRK